MSTESGFVYERACVSSDMCRELSSFPICPGNLGGMVLVRVGLYPL